jgi:hypothetical protein
MDSLEIAQQNENDALYCEYCRSENPEIPRDSMFHEHRLSARSGCPCCSMLVEGMRRVVRRFGLFPFGSWEDDSRVSLTRRENSAVLNTVYCARPDGYEVAHFDFFTDANTSCSDHPEYVGVADHIQQNNVLDGCLDFIKDTLVGCAAEHKNCNAATTPLLPKRLLEVRFRVDEGLSMRLIDDAATVIDNDINYCALSYCWGSDSVIKSSMLSMTKANIHELANWFPTSRLPPIFHDAAVVVNKLGLRYLWIDALCIAQGDPVEWSSEAPKMGEIYSSAHFTILASASATCQDSFLELKQREMCSSMKVPMREESGPIVYVRLAASRNRIPGQTMGDEGQSAVHRRGWVLQETLLSKRLVEFNHNIVTVSCLETILQEDGHQPNDRSILHWRREWSDIFSGRDTLDVRRLGELWHAVIDKYTIRQLTNEADRLPAVAGLASSLLKVGPSINAYWAGLWKNTFARDLAWRCSLQPVPSSRPTGASWTWASVKGHVEWFADLYNTRADTVILMEAKCSYGPSGPFGELQTAEVTLRGPWFKVFLVDSSVQRSSLNPSQQHVILYEDEARRWDSFIGSDSPSSSPEIRDSWYMDYRLEAVQAEDQPLRLQPILSCDPNFATYDGAIYRGPSVAIDLLLLYTEDIWWAIMATFLVLAKTTDEPARYRRLGLLKRYFYKEREGHEPARTEEYYVQKCKAWLGGLGTGTFTVV